MNDRVERLAYSPREAAAALGVSRAAIYNLIAAGQIVSVKIGGSRRIPATELERLITPVEDRPARPATTPSLRLRIPASVRWLVIERDGLSCGICGTDVADDDVHIDHVRPIGHGGNDDPANLRVTHSKCNMRRGNKLIYGLGSAS